MGHRVGLCRVHGASSDDDDEDVVNDVDRQPVYADQVEPVYADQVEPVYADQVEPVNADQVEPVYTLTRSSRSTPRLRLCYSTSPRSMS